MCHSNCLACTCRSTPPAPPSSRPGQTCGRGGGTEAPASRSGKETIIRKCNEFPKTLGNCIVSNFSYNSDAKGRWSLKKVRKENIPLENVEQRTENSFLWTFFLKKSSSSDLPPLVFLPPVLGPGLRLPDLFLQCTRLRLQPLELLLPPAVVVAHPAQPGGLAAGGRHRGGQGRVAIGQHGRVTWKKGISDCQSKY